MDTVTRFRKRELFAPASDRRPPELGAAGQDSRITGLAVNPAAGPGALRRQRREGANTPSPGANLAAGTAAKGGSSAASLAYAPTLAQFGMDPATRNGFLESVSGNGKQVPAETAGRARLHSTYIHQAEGGNSGLCERKA